MAPILPGQAAGVHEPHKRFVDEGRGLERMVPTLTRHVHVSQAPEFGFDQRQQLVERLLVALAPCSKQFCHVPR
jgi:hypothetical protein